MKYYLNISIKIVILAVLLLSACTLSQTTANNEIVESPIQVSTSVTKQVFASPTKTQETPITTTSSRTVTATLSPVTSTVMPAELPTSEPISTTPAYTSTPLPMITATAEIPSFLEGPLVGFRIDDLVDNYLLLSDIGKGTNREIRGELTNYPFEIQWFDNGCQMFIGEYLIDLNGKKLWQTPDIQWDNLLSEDAWSVGLIRLSPDKEWLAYQIWSGAQTYESAEFVDVGVINFNDTTSLIFLTKNGGAREIAWSSNGQWLAFSDYDDQGILQVYIATPEGEVVQQITNHTESLKRINYIVWSPDDEYIAYAVTNLLETTLPYQYKEGDEGWVGIVSRMGDLVQQITINKFGNVIDKGIWWNADSSRIVFVGNSLPIAGEEPTSGRQIHWAEVDTGTITNSFFETDAPSGQFELALAVGNIDTILFNSQEDFYLLDVSTNTIEKLVSDYNFAGLIRDANSGPFEFPGEANCQQ
ncbi:MAG: hypothetical protein ACE5FZ_09930 [Nitrospiria bacterium]